jgi:hypothetical protein
MAVKASNESATIIIRIVSSSHKENDRRKAKFPVPHSRIFTKMLVPETLTVRGAFYSHRTRQQEAKMPVLLLVGIPVLLLGGGYMIIHTMH